MLQNVTEAGCIDDTTQTGGVATGAITRRSHYHDECEGKESLNGMDANLQEGPLKGKYGLEKICLNQKFLTCFSLTGNSFELKVYLLPEITFKKLTFWN